MKALALTLGLAALVAVGCGAGITTDVMTETGLTTVAEGECCGGCSASAMAEDGSCGDCECDAVAVASGDCCGTCSVAKVEGESEGACCGKDGECCKGGEEPDHDHVAGDHDHADEAEAGSDDAA